MRILQQRQTKTIIITLTEQEARDLKGDLSYLVDCCADLSGFSVSLNLLDQLSTAEVLVANLPHPEQAW